MFRELHHTTAEAIIDLIRTLPERDQKVIVKTLSSSGNRRTRKAPSKRTEKDVLDTIKAGLEEIKESKRTGKPLKSLRTTLNELKNQR